MSRRIRPSALLALAVTLGAALAPSAQATEVTTGLAAKAPAASPPAPVQVAPSLRRRGVRHAHLAQPGAGAARLVPAAGPSRAASGPAPSVNFNGVSSLDSAVTNFGLEFEPPDQGLCVGNGFVVEMVNSAYTVYDESGRALAGPFNVNGPYGEGLTEFTSDPRCYYDAADHTWFATILAIGKGEETSSLDIAVNSSGDPRTVWTDYKIDTTDTPKHGGHGKECPCFGDQPKLGIDASNLYVTTDEFSILGPQFNGDQIYAFALEDLIKGEQAVHFAHFSKLAIAGAPANALQPATTTEAAPAEYFVGSIDPTETSGSSIGVWALTGAKTIVKGGKPTLSSMVLASQPFAVPVPAPQKGSATPIEAGDDRMQQAQFTGGRLWSALGTSLIPPGESTTRDGAAWFSVQPVLKSGVLGSKTAIAAQGYVSSPGGYFIYPALALTPSGHGAMTGALTGPKRFPSSAYTALGSSFGPVQVSAAGSGNYDPEGERWGDYSWAVADPAGAAVWLATEYVPPKSSQTPDGLHDWGTRVVKVPAG